MTIEEFYIEKQNLRAPDGLGFLEERDWYSKEIKKLQNQLSKSDLEIVLSRKREWINKVQSSLG